MSARRDRGGVQDSSMLLLGGRMVLNMLLLLLLLLLQPLLGNQRTLAGDFCTQAMSRLQSPQGPV